MSEWIRSALDLILILIVGAGLVQASRLIAHLAGLRQGRVDMERFVHEFNSTVLRAEAGIKGLRQAARESGDDLEKLVEKALAVRDELQFMTESADQIAERLSQSASNAARTDARSGDTKKETPPVAALASMAGKKVEVKDAPAPSSRAEKELLQALQKLS